MASEFRSADEMRVVPETEPESVLEPQPGEFYFDGPYMVFTEEFHLRRGWCCQSGCRHCPYGYRKREAADLGTP